jgi:hypothetical protein
MRDLFNNLHFVTAIEGAVKTAGENGATIDLQGYHSVCFVVTAGVLTTADASNYLALTVQTSPDGTTWTTVTDANVLQSNASGMLIDGVNVLATNTMKFALTHTSLMNRYVRVVATKTGTVSVTYSVIAVLGTALHAPAA